MSHYLFDIPRQSRRDIEPVREKGVYALFLKPLANLPLVEPAAEGLIYVGKADGQHGFRGRCHFVDRTVNHSPRKSLAVLLLSQLALEPRGYGGRKWGLEFASEGRLTEWMLDNLLIAYAPNDRPSAVEKEWVNALAPPLNLKLCAQSPAHAMISKLRLSAQLFANGTRQV